MDATKTLRTLITAMLLALTALTAPALSLSLDSVATWGRFPRFCVDTYRWGCDFFNGYDTTYVKGTGYKFNVKLKAETWMDAYDFNLPDNKVMMMSSEACTSTGVWLTYMAVSLGYDKNVSRFFGSNAKSKQKYTFGFDCSLFAVNMYYVDNKVGTTIRRFGERGDMVQPDIGFDGMNIQEHGIDMYYFFNHKKYSQAAAFGFSRLQQKSQGSFFAGLSYSNQNFDFDFNSLPDYIKDTLPPSWGNYRYQATTKNYAVKLGYGYNWVFSRRWTLGLFESPTVGLKRGYINNSEQKNTSFALYNEFRLSMVWNYHRWFAGVVGTLNTGIFYDEDNAFITAEMSATVSVGYRFNLW